MTSGTMASENMRDVQRCPDCGGPLIKVPLLQCTHCEKVHPLRAFTYRSRGHHIAECIDLDLLAQGNTVDEAIGKLQEAMFSYLEVAFTEGESTNGLVLRPSPLSHRLRYYAHDLVSRLAPRTKRPKHFVLRTPELRGHSLSHC